MRLHHFSLRKKWEKGNLSCNARLLLFWLRDAAPPVEPSMHTGSWICGLWLATCGSISDSCWCQLSRSVAVTMKGRGHLFIRSAALLAQPPDNSCALRSLAVQLVAAGLAGLET